MLEALAKTRGQSRLPIVAEQLQIPLSTAYRLVEQLQQRQLLLRVGKGCYVAGPSLTRLGETADPATTFAELARPAIRRLARRHRLIVHLGVWDGEMMTYLVKENGSNQKLFTREGGQLEAYCSAIGRVVLAHLPRREREAYLSDGVFVPLTQRTVIDPAKIEKIFEDVRQRGYALEREEIAEGLHCIAVPVRSGDGGTAAGLSIAMLNTDQDVLQYLEPLRTCAAEIHKKNKALQTGQSTPAMEKG